MRRVIISSLIICLCFFSINAIAKEESSITTKTENMNKYENIVFLGDSIFDWFPTDKIFSDLPIVNSGIAGNTTEDILNSLENRVYKFNPTKVFLNIGTNDLDCPDSDEINIKVFENIKKIVSEIRKNRENCKIYIISIYPVNNYYAGAKERHIDEIKTVNGYLKEYCANEDIEYIDAFKELANGEEMLDEEYTSDGLHPNHLGYAKLTEILMKYIYE